MTYIGPERRKSPRMMARFMVSYRIIEEIDNIDVTQTKNIGIGGMLLTTNKYFPPGTKLALEIRLPIDPVPIMLLAKVIESTEVTKELIYDTRLEFLAVDENHRRILTQTLKNFRKK